MLVLNKESLLGLLAKSRGVISYGFLDGFNSITLKIYKSDFPELVKLTAANGFFLEFFNRTTEISCPLVATSTPSQA